MVGTTQTGARAQVKFWPANARTAILLVPLILAIGLGAWALFREALGAEDAPAEWILLGIVILSLLPVALLLLDGLASSGGSVEVGQVKIALTAAATTRVLTVAPRNVAAGPNIGDSGSEQIYVHPPLSVVPEVACWSGGYGCVGSRLRYQEVLVNAAQQVDGDPRVLPRFECHFVTKDGIASGVVDPQPIAEFATFRGLRNLGGAGAAPIGVGVAVGRVVCGV